MKPRIGEAVIVEGRYDRNTLLQVVDAVIVETNGFGVFSDAEKLELIRRLAEEKGVILLTDSDGAGQVIRGHLRGMLPPDRVKQAYIPEISGKERRKRIPGKEHLLGVEGMDPETILRALERAGATFLDETQREQIEVHELKRADFIEAGLSGAEGASEKRTFFCKELGLPTKLSAPALFSVLKALLTREELFDLVRKFSERA